MKRKQLRSSQHGMKKGRRRRVIAGVGPNERMARVQAGCTQISAVDVTPDALPSSPRLLFTRFLQCANSPALAIPQSRPWLSDHVYVASFVAVA